MMAHEIGRIIRGIRGLLLAQWWKLRGIAVADRAAVEGRAPKLVAFGCMKLGARLSFRGMKGRTVLLARGSGTLEIGDRCFINGDVSIEASALVRIGAHCLIGDSVMITDTTAHEIDQHRPKSSAPVSIGRNVWIGSRAIILPGVTIGEHSVVGAGSLVTKSFPARSIIAGNPARQVGQVEAGESWVRR